MTVILPSDVIDYIFSLLQSDCAALRKCSIAHPFLASLAERYLYVNISLQNCRTRKDPKFLPAELVEIFDKKPEILNNVVQGLSIDLVPMESLEMQCSLEDVAYILYIVAPRLRSISVKARITVAWYNFGEAFHTAFWNCMLSPSLTEVSLHRIVGLQLFEVVGRRNLRHLFLQGAVSSFIWFQIPQHNPLLNLESLSLYDFGDLYGIVDWGPFRNLRALDFRGWMTGDLDIYKDLFDHCSHSLTCLRIDLSGFCKYNLTF